MAVSLICVHEGHDDCEMVNCACVCHIAFREETLRTLDALVEKLSTVFPDDNDLTGPPVVKALRFVSEAVRLYCNVPISMEDAQALVQAERNLSQILCQGMYTLEVEA